MQTAICRSPTAQLTHTDSYGTMYPYTGAPTLLPGSLLHLNANP